MNAIWKTGKTIYNLFSQVPLSLISGIYLPNSESAMKTKKVLFLDTNSMVQTSQEWKTSARSGRRTAENCTSTRGKDPMTKWLMNTYTTTTASPQKPSNGCFPEQRFILMVSHSNSTSHKYSKEKMKKIDWAQIGQTSIFLWRIKNSEASNNS